MSQYEIGEELLSRELNLELNKVYQEDAAFVASLADLETAQQKIEDELKLKMDYQAVN